ncbi:MAG: hypothetical protein KAZ28_02320 [Bacteroidaceae bacterium]|mgnify:FL=1|jgi:hypothetical protein|nr:hypothetical protein [Bacteroidaceae bacterium]
MKTYINYFFLILIVVLSSCHQKENKRHDILDFKLIGVSDNYFENLSLMERTSYYSRRIGVYCRVYNKANESVFFPFNYGLKDSIYSSSINVYLNGHKVKSYIHLNNRYSKTMEIPPKDSMSFNISFWIPSPDYYGIKQKETLKSIVDKIDIKYHSVKLDKKYSKYKIYPISFKKKENIIYLYRDSSTINDRIDWIL